MIHNISISLCFLEAWKLHFQPHWKMKTFSLFLVIQGIQVSLSLVKEEYVFVELRIYMFFVVGVYFFPVSLFFPKCSFPSRGDQSKMTLPRNFANLTLRERVGVIYWIGRRDLFLTLSVIPILRNLDYLFNLSTQHYFPWSFIFMCLYYKPWPSMFKLLVKKALAISF